MACCTGASGVPEGGPKGGSGHRALVTGGAGFLGSHLCGRLLSEGWRVICMDNLRTGSLENIEHLREDPNFDYVDHDVTIYIDIPGGLDEIYHFASPASPADFERIPIPILKVGALGTYNSLGLAKAKGARLMLASTSEVYGDPMVHPQPEGYWGNVNPIGVRGVYDEAKRYAEAITMAYHRHHGVDTRIVRIFNTFGPKMRPDDGRMIPNFISQALSGASDDLRRRGPDAERTVRGRSHRRRNPAHAEHGDPPRQHRQPGRVHRGRGGGAYPGDSPAVRAGSPTSLFPPTTPTTLPGHNPRPRNAGMGATLLRP